MATKILNLDEIEVSTDKGFKFKGVQHDMQPLSVGDFIAQMKKIDKLKGENVSEAAAIEFMREAVIAAFPTLTPEDANGMKLSQLRVLVEFIKDDAEGAEAEGKPPQE